MTHLTHPDSVLFAGEARFPILPAVDHYAGSEKMMRKALDMQRTMGPVFDVTCDCEDGAAAGAELAHAELCATIIDSAANAFDRVGVRIHDVSHAAWRAEAEVLVRGAGARLPFITLPKARSAQDVRAQIGEIDRLTRAAGIARRIPVHVLIETHGALREVWEIAAIDGVESLDFGLMDFVSAHHGAIPGSAMESPGQFAHPLLVRAKCEIAAAALANGVVPTHNVTTEIRDASVIRDDALRARREFGFLRMWSIHPNQIAPIIEAMRPDFAEIESAAAILAQAQDREWGPVQHAGRLHDRASYRYWWELLRRARSTGCELPADAVHRFFNEPPAV